MRRSRPITRYDDFTDFGDFIETAKKIQEEENHKAMTREQSLREATETLEKVPDYIWERLQEARYITREPLKWLGTKQLFAYFVAKACDTFEIKETFLTEKSGLIEVRILKAFEIIFNMPGLRGKIRDAKRFPPAGYKEIDKILQK